MGTLFWRNWLQASVCADEDALALDDVSPAMIGDAGRIEDPDAAEDVEIVAVDRVAQVIRVTRGLTPYAHPQDTAFYGIRSTDIPVEIIQETTPWNDDPSVVVVDPGAPTIVTITTKLRVRWRQSDTAAAGSYYLEVRLIGPEGEKLTFPRDKIGYPVKIVVDSDGA